MVVELSRDDLIGDLTDQVASFFIQELQLDIGHGRGLFEDTQCLDELSRHCVPTGARLKIFQRTLSLRAPVAVRGDGNFTHRVAFNPSLRHCRAPFLCLVASDLNTPPLSSPSRGGADRSLPPRRGKSLP